MVDEFGGDVFPGAEVFTDVGVLIAIFSSSAGEESRLGRSTTPPTTTTTTAAPIAIGKRLNETRRDRDVADVRVETFRLGPTRSAAGRLGCGGDGGGACGDARGTVGLSAPIPRSDRGARGARDLPQIGRSDDTHGPYLLCFMLQPANP